MTHARTLLLALALSACSSSPSSPDSRTPADVGRDGPAAEVGADGAQKDLTAADKLTGDGPAKACVPASCTATLTSGSVKHGAYTGAIKTTGTGCQRSYTLSTDQPLVAGTPTSPRTVAEKSGWPTVRTCNPLFDALYALALEEVRQNSVASISDGAFNNGKPMQCPAGGCFETGQKWKYVWTRDTAYAVDLALAALDPVRAKNSLLFKLSKRRDGTGLEIVQDTGTGGSWPVSTDRVVWSLGARRLLHFLYGAERTTFRDTAYEALVNTIARDRAVAFDSADGLYRGEQSFLDWREQSYPAWVKGDPIHIAMSKALSTNAGHLSALELAADLATEKGLSAAAATYKKWTADLRAAMGKGFYIADAKLFSTFIPTSLDPGPARQYDLLGSALAVLTGVATAAQAPAVVSSYPHLEHGAPVIWPQQQATAIYHNRAIWPFVTAYWMRAARRADNARAAEFGLKAMMKGAALNLSNMENFEMVSLLPHVKDGAYSGPVVNSPRQLWSVAGYVSMVHDVLFGMETSAKGIRFLPYVPASMRSRLLPASDSLVLNRFPYHGKHITVVVHLPTMAGSVGGAYKVGSIKLNGKAISTDYVAPAKLAAINVWEVTLLRQWGPEGKLTWATNTSDYRNLFGPKPPKITGVAVSGGKLKVSFNGNGEAAAAVTFAIYRDGKRVAKGLTGSSSSWTDASTSSSSPSHCYAVEATFKVSGNASQRSAPWCYWGPGSGRVTTIEAKSFKNTGGTGVLNHGKYHFQDWGDPGHTLVVDSFKPKHSGWHLLQLTAGNGAGPVNTGVTCGLKALKVEQHGVSAPVATGYIVMPHLGAWTAWKDSSFLRVKLTAGKTYRFTLHSDKHAVNMSAFAHFKQYTGGKGGSAGAFSRVNVAALKVLSLGK